MSQFFPLPFTLWEELFVVDDYDHYPANFMVRIRCRGKLSHGLFRQALTHCLDSHPLFACVAQRRGRNYYWIPADQQDLPVEFSRSENEPEIPTMNRFDIAAERLWKVLYIEWQNDSGQDCTDILVDIHHSLCDGLGAIQFISDVAREIHDLNQPPNGTNDGQAVGQNSAFKSLRDPNTDWEALRDRGKFPQNWKDWLGSLRFYYKSIIASLKLIFTRVAPLVPLQTVPVYKVNELLDIPRERLGYEKIVLSPTESSRLRRVCRLANTTVNSRLTSELFAAIADWKRLQNHPEFNALRIMMPFNERTLKDARLPACNRVTLSPFTRNLKQIDDPQRLLSSIEEGVKLVKKARLGINFHRGLRFCKTFLGSLKTLARTDRIGATAMFANVGNLQAHLGLPVSAEGTVCGPLTIVDVDLVPPIRIGTSFAVTFHEFDGRSRLGIQYDSNWISTEQAMSFFQFFKQRVVQLTE